MEKTWDRVTLLWDFGGQNIAGGGIATSITPTGSFDREACPANSMANRRLTHVLGKMQAISQPRNRGQRRGVIKLDIAGCFHNGSNKPPRDDAIVGFIKQAVEKMTKEPSRKRKWGVQIEPPPVRYHGHGKSWMDTEFTLSFALDDGEQFCDSVIEIARAVFEGLGVHDESGLWLARFTLRRETFVNVDGAWISFARWLRISHGLPIHGPEDSFFEALSLSPTL